MRESRSYGSVRGALRNERPYRDHIKKPFDKKGLFWCRSQMHFNFWF